MYGDPYRAQLPGERRELPQEQRQQLYVSIQVPTDVVDPGTEVVVNVTVSNRGTIVERVFLEVLGAPAPWSTIEPAQIELFPDTEGTAQVRISPPRYAHTPTGPVAFRVQVRSTVNPTVGAFADGTLTVGSFEALDAKLVPAIARGRRRGKYRLALANTGNLPIQARIMAGDPEIALLFQVSSPRLEIPPGTVLTTDILVKPERRRWVGPDAQRPFEIRIEHQPAAPAGTPSGPPDTLPVQGTFVQLSYFPRWLIPAVAALGVASVSFGVYTLLRPGPGSEPAAGQTVIPTTEPPTQTAAPAPTPAPSPTQQPQPTTPPAETPKQQPSPPPPTVEPPPQPPPTTMPPSPPPVTEPDPYKNGTLTVRQTFLADLDEGVETDAGADFWFEADTATERFITPVNDTWIATFGSIEPTYDACTMATYSNQRVPVQALQPGDVFCMRTESGRISAARLEAEPGPSPGQLQLTYITWPPE